MWVTLFTARYKYTIHDLGITTAHTVAKEGDGEVTGPNAFDGLDMMRSQLFELYTEYDNGHAWRVTFNSQATQPV